MEWFACYIDSFWSSAMSAAEFLQQLGGSSPGKHSPGCIEFGKYEINSWYSSPFPRDLAKYVCKVIWCKKVHK